MSRRTEHAPSLGRLVHGAQVVLEVLKLRHIHRNHPDNRHGREEHLRIGLAQHVLVPIPFAPFHEQPLAEDPVRGGDLALSVEIHHLKVKVNLVDGDPRLAGVVLLGPRQEGLR